MKSYVQPIIRVNECLLETVFLSGSPQRGILGKANTTGGKLLNYQSGLTLKK